MATKEEVELRLQTGLRNLWHPVLAEWQLGANPMGITRLGDQIVLWRDGNVIHAIEDRCPHRAARLSLGCNLGKTLACWYHGVEVDADGRIADVPALERSGMVGRKAVRSYPVQVAHGAVFLWFGAGEPAPFVLPPELTAADFTGYLCTTVWRCDYRYALDNVMDPMHGTYLHAVSHSMASGRKTAKMKLQDTSAGFIYTKADQQGVNFDWVEFGETGLHWMKTTIPYRPDAGPGGPFWIIGMVTPIKPGMCQMFIWRMRNLTGWQADSWRFLYRMRLESLHWDVLEQDRRILESLPPRPGTREMLYEHDVAVVRLRRRLDVLARVELQQEQEQGAGSSVHPSGVNSGPPISPC